MLSNEEIKNYRANGYLILRSLFSKIEMQELRKASDNAQDKAFDLIKNQDGLEVKNLKDNQIAIMYKGTQFVIKNNNLDNYSISRIVWVGSYEPKFLKYGRDPRITEAVSQILESKTANHLMNQIHPKLPGDGVGYRWHQDVQHRKSFCPQWVDINPKTGSFVVAVTAIDDVALDSGPLLVIPGSHEKELDFVGSYDSESLPADIDKEKIIPMLLAAGDTLFMHPYLLHGSQPNKSSHSRTVMINGFSYPGANAEDCKYPGENSAELINLTN